MAASAKLRKAEHSPRSLFSAKSRLVGKEKAGGIATTAKKAVQCRKLGKLSGNRNSRKPFSAINETSKPSVNPAGTSLSYGSARRVTYPNLLPPSKNS